MILTNSRMHQSALWRAHTRNVAAPGRARGELADALRLVRARRGAEGVVVLGARAALYYGALTRLLGAGPPWVAKELLLDPPGRGPRAALKRAAYRWAVRGCRAFAVYSEHERAACAAGLGVPPERCVFVPFHCRREPAAEPLPGTGPFLAAGRSRRDYATLARAVREAGCRLTVVAPPAEARHFAGLPGVEFRGELPDAEYRAVLEAATAVVVPLPPTPRSVGQAVVLEAMALGKPVLAAAVPGLADYLDPEETALTYRPGDAADLARQLGRLADPALRARLGRAALQRVRERYTPDHHARAVLDLVRRAGERP
ncbi:MAG TPA: glycosyltransferase family 4 protein [Candidatus Saccharimonadales bacterium]|nr:glycosyltransferase family 4 protein [Candidatus Saccharimonadales bacterium]